MLIAGADFGPVHHKAGSCLEASGKRSERHDARVRQRILPAYIDRAWSMSDVEPLWRRIMPRADWIAAPEALPLVSVVVTAYNYERFILSCLNSVAAQSYTNLECIVVDDCSSDETAELITQAGESFGRNRYRVVRNKVNVGQMASQSIGLMHSRGPFVVFLDADDLVSPNFIERHIFAQLNGEYPTGLSVSDQITIDDQGVVHSGTRLDFNALIEVRTARQQLISAGEDSLPLLTVFLPWSDVATQQPHSWYWQTQSAMMFRRSVLNLIVPPPDDCGAFRICADFYLARFAHLVANSMILQEPLGAYRQHSQNNFSGSEFMTTDQQGGDARRLPSYASYVELVRSTIKLRQNLFDARLGSFRLSQIDAVLNGKSADGKQWRHSAGMNGATIRSWLPPFLR
jgi:glycosyltransferase involved in cell wall biosynthesis